MIILIINNNTIIISFFRTVVVANMPEYDYINEYNKPMYAAKNYLKFSSKISVSIDSVARIVDKKEGRQCIRMHQLINLALIDDL